MRAVIKAGSVISPQHTHNADDFPKEIHEGISNRLTCIEPEYRNIINPIQLRRMPRILKMGLTTAQLCINRAGGISPDGIIVGTGLGCLDNLEKFMMEVLENNEHVTSVLPFINSTHNAVAAQVAMLLKNHNYNVTYCHRGFSFESALQDAIMLLEEKQSRNILVGGIDECTNDFMHLHNYLGYWKEPLNNLKLISEKSPGTIAGEGSAFFVLTNEPVTGNHRGVAIEDVHTFFTPSEPNPAEIEKEIDLFLQSIHTDKQDIDGVMLGLNGDNRYDKIYYSLLNEYFSQDTDFMYYKHLCGEYYTSGAFALWLGSVILGNKQIPDVIRLNKGSHTSMKNLLIYNQIRNAEHSLIFLNYERF
jgi:3-oxoacyl-[acyl-carrier-protein] synthase II